MAINDIQIQRLFDPEALAQSIPYVKNGLTYRSNNNSIHPRDEAGNIVFQENSETNPLLIIEPVTPNIVNSSVLRVVDTTFRYFKFPVAGSTEVPEISVQDLQLDISELPDQISTRYVIPYEEFPEGVPNTYRKLSTSFSSGWFSGTEDADLFTSGYIRLPFTGPNQAEPGTFTITPDVLQLLRDQGKTIKFSVQMLVTPRDKTLDTAYRLRIRNDNPNFRNWAEPTIYTTTLGNYQSGDFPLLKIDYVLNLEDIAEYDKFSIEAVAGRESWYLSDYTYWDIELIDNVPELLENFTNGVTFISPNTDLIINGEVVVSGQQ